MNKHVFVLAESDAHTQPLLKFLFQQMTVPREGAVVLFSGGAQGPLPSWVAEHPGLTIDRYPNVDRTGLRDAESVTLLSLLPWNAELVCDMHFNVGIPADHFRVIVTDDEVDRWQAVFEEHGRLVEDPGRLVSASVLRALGFVNTFIGSREPWGAILSTVLGREVQCSNTQLLLHVLPDEAVREFVDENIAGPAVATSLANRELHVLLLSKPRHARESMPWLWELLRFVMRHEPKHRKLRLHVSLWVRPLLRHPVYALLLSLIHYLGRIRGMNVVFTAHAGVPREVYYVHLTTHHALIFQDRGGLTALNSYFAQGGFVCLQKDSLNYRQVEGNYPFMPRFILGSSGNVFRQLVEAVTEGGLTAFAANREAVRRGYERHVEEARAYFVRHYS